MTGPVSAPGKKLGKGVDTGPMLC